MGLVFVPLFVLGLLLVSNVKGFTEVVFDRLRESLPASSSARPGNLRLVGVFLLIVSTGGGLGVLTGFLT
ncbi:MULTISPECIES: hypothetical protein [Streptomyces]|uniref:hypothetical protein n=1 Tax=Streptomyces TaxID=1883 RepID=UPI0004BD6B25|nr:MULTISPECIES: hypothetical protein [Streptomyces]QHF93254.1 hypothetical protein DEH18_04375 [Streptomyces sp. NHF165]